ncbi:MAG TPA: nucleotidyltransferase domain-containing protein [Sedimentisphaerales bacterium]|jgi:predicted nucleotidyltransferase|nr:nucleotidyltransferase domain-containing protein [Sedimentisphaerales bacterium]HNU27871.1 nucleotidyltransferase domain-containing protein [Sedimentisphaerales bacterium]
MDLKIKRLVDQVKAHLHERYGEGIKRVVLFGSHARGEATKDSDVDVLVLVDQSLNPREVEDSLSDLLYDIVLNEGELVSVIAVTQERFENYNSPFMLNVRREGMTA